MISIVKAGENDNALLSELAKITFMESHGHSAKPEDINNYVSEKYNEYVLKQELGNLQNLYHIINYNNKPAGYSKIIFDLPYTNSSIQNIAKLERLYLLKEFHDLKLGFELFQFNITLAKKNNQSGIWLYVWKENQKAIDFYLKTGFHIISSYNFKISETHSNPNHQMFFGF